MQFRPVMHFFFTIYRLVEKINFSIGQDRTSKNLIGVLDIYGFESFKNNRWQLNIYIYIFCVQKIKLHID